MAYISPGDAFTSGLQDFYAREEAARLAAERERRQALHDQMEMDQAREALAEKRRAFDEAQKDKRKSAFEKTVGEMVMGDIPSAELLEQAKEFGMMHKFPGAEVTATPQVPEPPPSIALPPEEMPATPIAPAGAVHPPLMGGFRFGGTRQERLQAQQSKEAREFAANIPPDMSKEQLVFEWEARFPGRPVPANLIKADRVANVGTFEDYVTQRFGERPTSAQVEQARKKWADLGREEGGAGGATHFQLQPELDTTGKPTGKFYGYNSKTNKFELVEGITTQTTKAPPGASPLALEANKKKSALNTLDQLDKAIDEAKEFLGPGPGRVTSIEQMVGSADPRAHAMATKMLMAKMKIDAAIGGVRAAASPQLLARWDNILGFHTSPDSLHAAVRSLREIMSELGEEDEGKAQPKQSGLPRYDMNGKPVKE